jgi:16S rRNA (cytosine967-C5)-methyltransferase
MAEKQSRKNTDARWIAFQILSRLHESNSSVLLQQSLSRVEDTKERHLITGLVLGVLRWQGRLLWTIQQFSKRPLDRLDREVLLILELGVYQLLFTTIAQHAAIYETVRLCKRARLTSASSFVNGILRRIQEKCESLPEPPLPQRLSHPEWLVSRWVERFGQKEAEALMTANNEPPPLYIRVNELIANPDSVISSLASEDVVVQPTRFSSSVLLVQSGAPQLTKSFAEGAFYIQDAAMEKLGDFVRPNAGDRILEVSAAPGGKTFQLAVRMKNQGFIMAMDSDVKRMRMWQRNMARMQIQCASAAIADARTTFLLGHFDKVVIDAPCSSMGVMRRHPEIKWWRKEADLETFRSLQLQILDACAKYVRSQGELIYSVCSFEPEETEDVRKALLAMHSDLELIDQAYLFPHRDQTDGFFMMKFSKK